MIDGSFFFMHYQNLEQVPIFVLAVIIVLAGFSQAVGHSGVLFINKVKPARFLLSLLSATFFYLARISVWLLSLWMMLLFIEPSSLKLVASILIISRIPQVFAFLEFLPVIGVLQAWVISFMGLCVASYLLHITSSLGPAVSGLAVSSSWLFVFLVRHFLSLRLLNLRAYLLSQFYGVKEFKTSLEVEDLLPQVLTAEKVSS